MAGGRPGLTLVLFAVALWACASSVPSVEPSSVSAATPTPGPGDPLPEREAAIARAISLAEIGGPFVVAEGIQGSYADLDVESHNNVSGPPVKLSPASTRVWRVTLRGPNGSESMILAAADGGLIGAVTQGH